MNRYRKFITADVAALGVILSSGLLHGTAETVLNVLLAAVGAALVYLVPNDPAPAPAASTTGVPPRVG